jgi:hypothetical protein
MMAHQLKWSPTNSHKVPSITRVKGHKAPHISQIMMIQTSPIYGRTNWEVRCSMC